MMPSANSAKAKSPAIGRSAAAASAALVMLVMPCACKVTAVASMIASATRLEKPMPTQVSMPMRRNSRGAARGLRRSGALPWSCISSTSCAACQKKR